MRHFLQKYRAFWRSLCIVVVVHALPFWHWYQRQLMVSDQLHSTERYRMNTAQRAYIAARQGNYDRTIQLLKEEAAITTQAAYNLGTYLAIHSIYSGSTLDTAELAEAEKYLSGAADLDLTNHSHILHNLAAVRARLDMLSAEQQTGSAGLPLVASGSVPENVPTSGGGSTLSDPMIQQLSEYQENLEQEQAKYQWGFGKLPPLTGTSSGQKDR